MSDPVTQKSFEKLPPHNIEAEQYVLSALLLDAARLPFVVERMAPDDFYRPIHQTIYEMEMECIKQHGTVDLLLLRAEAERRGVLDQIGGAAYLAQLMDVAPTAANVTYHADLIREKAQKRRLLNLCINMTYALYDDKQPFQEAFTVMHEQLVSINHEPTSWVRTVNGRPKGILEREYARMIDELGFKAIRFAGALTFGYIEKNIVEEVEWFKQICFTVKKKLKDTFEDKHPALWELLLNENKFDYRVMTTLNTRTQEEFLRDTATACHLFFQNGMVKVEPQAVTFTAYDQIGGLVWKDAITPYPYQGRHVKDCAYDVEQEQKQHRESDFERFVRLVSSQDVEGHFVDNKLAFEHGLAHLCWHYNDVLHQKAVVLIDNDPSAFSDGRRGKRILLDALRYIRSNGTPDGVVIKEDGKAFGGTFKFQRVKPNTKVLIIDDVDEQLVNIKQFYSAITDGLVKEGKGMTRCAFTPETSPKIGFTANAPFFSVDMSSTDRLLILPMTDFFTRPGNKPIDVFGHRLYYDWDAAEWARFHDYMVRIIQQAMYRDHTQIPPVDLSVFNANRITMDLPETFVYYMDQMKDDTLYRMENVLAELEQRGITFTKKSGQFKHQVEIYSRLRERPIKKNTKDGRYKSNGVEYLCFESDLFRQSKMARTDATVQAVGLLKTPDTVTETGKQSKSEPFSNNNEEKIF